VTVSSLSRGLDAELSFPSGSSTTTARAAKSTSLEGVVRRSTPTGSPQRRSASRSVHLAGFREIQEVSSEQKET